MDKKVYSLFSGSTGCSGYAAVSGRGGSTAVSFSLKNLPCGRYSCLFFQDEVLPCGTVTASKPFLHCELPLRAVHPSFGVFKERECIMFNGTREALNAMQRFADSSFPPHAGEFNDSPYLSQSAPPATDDSATDDSATDGIAPENYYRKNRAMFCELMNSNPHITSLEELMPGSRWITVPEGYIVGIICDERCAPLYICYGVEGQSSQQPPDDLKDYCHWLSLPCSDTGWWVLYQNAVTGEALTV